MPSPDTDLGAAELEVLRTLWDEGPATVRRLLTQAAWQAIRRAPTVRALFTRLQHGDPERKKKAVVADSESVEPGPEENGTQNGTPIGFAVLELFSDGRVTCEYRGFDRDELLRI